MRKWLPRGWRAGYSFLIPGVVLLGLFLVYPVVDGFALSFYQWNGFGPAKFVGLSNFQELATDTIFWDSFTHNLIYSVGAVAGTVVLGLILGILVDMGVRGGNFFKGIFYLTVMLPSIVTGLLWTKIYDPLFGLVNGALRAIGLDSFTRTWLADPQVTLGALVAKDVWQFTGFCFIVFLAGLANIDDTLYDAAKIDGASRWNVVRYITLPLIKAVFVVVVALQIMFSFGVFDTIIAMTAGGPGTSTYVMAYYLYVQAFYGQRFGYGSAIAVMMFIIIFSISLVYLKWSKLAELV